jgi:hypothetical protein
MLATYACVYSARLFGAISEFHLKRCQQLTRSFILLSGGGSHEFFVASEGKKAVAKVAQLLSRAQQPAVGQIQLEWLMSEYGAQANQTPKTIPSLFSGERRIIYAFLDKHCVETRLKALAGGQELETGVATHELNFKKVSTPFFPYNCSLFSSFLFFIFSTISGLFAAPQSANSAFFALFPAFCLFCFSNIMTDWLVFLF